MSEPTSSAGAATSRKALAINLDRSAYGAFAEIGAGQEVVRHFFKAGGASGTVAKSISAYDMRVSDAIYGHPQRYVSRQRLEQMLDHEYGLLVDRLKAERGPVTRFFAFADTVATTPHDGKGQGHSWIGIRFQDQPGAEPSEVILHLRLWDKDAGRQQDALGAVGVNLIHAALNTRDSVDTFLTALVDEVGSGRVEIEFAHFSGPAFGAFDNRAAALRLVRLGLTDAVLFGPEGDPQVPSEYFYKRSVLVARGTFRPVSLVNEDMLACALRALPEGGKEVIALFEMCIGSDPHPEAELIDRIRLVGAMQHPLLVTRHRGWYRLPAYFRLHTTGSITLVAGMNNLVDLFNPEHYTHLEGGVLDALREIGRSIHDLEKIDPSTASLFEGFKSAQIELTELESSVQDYAEELEIDPAELAQLDQRIHTIQTLKRKYGSSVQAILDFLAYRTRVAGVLAGRAATLAYGRACAATGAST